jgi:hypothetical protein
MDTITAERISTPDNGVCLLGPAPVPKVHPSVLTSLSTVTAESTWSTPLVAFHQGAWSALLHRPCMHHKMFFVTRS